MQHLMDLIVLSQAISYIRANSRLILLACHFPFLHKIIGDILNAGSILGKDE